MIYQAKIVKNDDGWSVSFPDKENIFTEGVTFEEAFRNAEDALNLTLDTEFNLGMDIEPSRRHKGKDLYDISVNPQIVVAYELKAMRAGKTQLEFAHTVGTTQQDYQRLEKSKSNPTIRTLEKIARANGKRLEIHFV